MTDSISKLETTTRTPDSANSNVIALRFNGEEVSMKEVMEKCKPVIESYYDSIRPRPNTNAEKCLALQIELGRCWTPHQKDQKVLLEYMLLSKRGNVYFPNEQVYI